MSISRPFNHDHSQANHSRINESQLPPNDTTSVLCSRIEYQSSHNDANLSDLKEFLDTSNASKLPPKPAADLKKQSNFHRPSKSMNEAIFTKFSLKENPRFFEPLLKKPGTTVQSPSPTIQTLPQLAKKAQKAQKKDSGALNQSRTSPEKSPNGEKLTRQTNTAKVHIVTPVPFPDRADENEELSQSSESSEEAEEIEEKIEEKQVKAKKMSEVFSKKGSESAKGTNRVSTGKVGEELERLERKTQDEPNEDLKEVVKPKKMSEVFSRKGSESAREKTNRVSIGKLGDELERLERKTQDEPSEDLKELVKPKKMSEIFSRKGSEMSREKTNRVSIGRLGEELERVERKIQEELSEDFTEVFKPKKMSEVFSRKGSEGAREKTNRASIGKVGEELERIERKIQEELSEDLKEVVKPKKMSEVFSGSRKGSESAREKTSRASIGKVAEEFERIERKIQEESSASQERGEDFKEVVKPKKMSEVFSRKGSENPKKSNRVSIGKLGQELQESNKGNMQEELEKTEDFKEVVKPKKMSEVFSRKGSENARENNRLSTVERLEGKMQEKLISIEDSKELKPQKSEVFSGSRKASESVKESLNGEVEDEKGSSSQEKGEEFKEKKKKRATMEERLDEKLKKLAEEKKQRSLSMLEKEGNKGVTLNDFLDQKFKELRQTKVAETDPKPLETTDPQEKGLGPIKKEDKNEETVYIPAKQRKSTANGLQKESIESVAIKKRAQSTVLEKITRESGQIQIPEPFFPKPEKKLNILQDPEVEKVKALEERKIETPTFESRQAFQKGAEGQRENAEIESSKIIVKMDESGAFSRVGAAEPVKKKSNLKSQNSLNMGKPHRSRSVAFNLKDFSKIIEFDEIEQENQQDSVPHPASKPTAMEQEHLIINTGNAQSLQPLNVSQAQDKSSSFLNSTNDHNNETLDQKDQEANEILTEFIETVTKKPAKSNKNRSFSLEPALKPSVYPDLSAGFNSCDDETTNNNLSNPAAHVKAPKPKPTHKLRASKTLPVPDDRISELSNENSPISYSQPKPLPDFDITLSQVQVVDLNPVSEKPKEQPEETYKSNNEAIIREESRKSRPVDAKRPSSVQYLNDTEDLFSRSESEDQEKGDESSGDSKSSEESDGRKIRSDYNLDLKALQNPQKSKIKKLIKRTEEKANEKPVETSENVNKRTDMEGNKERKTEVIEEKPQKNDGIPAEIERKEVKQPEKLEKDRQFKSLFEAKKSMNPSKKPVTKPGTAPKKPSVKPEIAAEIQKVEAEILLESQRIQELREKTSAKTPEKPKSMKHPKEEQKQLEIDFSGNLALFSEQEKALMEEILFTEAKLEKIQEKISVKTFLWVKTIIKPHEEILRICKSLLFLILIDQKLELSHWKKIQVYFTSPNDILAAMQSFKSNVYSQKLPQRNIDKSKENFPRIEESSKKAELLEGKIFKDFFVPIEEFIVTSHKFIELVGKLAKSAEKRNFSLPSEIERIKGKSRPQEENSRSKVRLHQSHSPAKRQGWDESRAKTPDATLNWRFHDSHLGFKTPSKDGVIMDIIDRSFARKYEQGHCFVYEDLESEDISASWRELLNLRGEIAKLLWEEERRVRKAREQQAKSAETKEIEYNRAKAKENESLRLERDKSEKSFLKEMKREIAVQNQEARKEETVNKKAEVLDDLQRSSEFSSKFREIKQEFKISSRLEIKKREALRKQGRINEMEQRIEIDAGQLENTMKRRAEEKAFKLRQLEKNKGELKKVLENLRVLTNQTEKNLQ